MRGIIDVELASTRMCTLAAVINAAVLISARQHLLMPLEMSSHAVIEPITLQTRCGRSGLCRITYWRPFVFRACSTPDWHLLCHDSGVNVKVVL